MVDYIKNAKSQKRHLVIKIFVGQGPLGSSTCNLYSAQFQVTRFINLDGTIGCVIFPTFMQGCVIFVNCYGKYNATFFIHIMNSWCRFSDRTFQVFVIRVSRISFECSILPTQFENYYLKSLIALPNK